MKKKTVLASYNFFHNNGRRSAKSGVCRLHVFQFRLPTSKENAYREDGIKTQLIVQYMHEGITIHTNCIRIHTYFFAICVVHVIYLSQAGKWIETPCIRFIGHTISFLMFLTLILISTLAEGVTDTNKLSFFLTVHEKYSWYRNQSSQPLPKDFAIRVYSPDIITFLLSLWIFGKYSTPIHSICSSDVNLRDFVLFLEFTCICYIFKDHKASKKLFKRDLCSYTCI